MKILILGGAGMLGHKLVQTMEQQDMLVSCTLRGLRSDFPVNRIPFYNLIEVHERIDAMDTPALKALLAQVRPDYIINCIGIIKQRSDATSAVPSIVINSLLPHLLAEWAEDWGGRVIHFSTDCVFSGNKGNYTTADPSDAEDLYGKSKFLGEVQRPNSLTLRTSIIGRELSHFASLVEWFLAQTGPSVQGYRRAVYSGMTTQTMADLVIGIVRQNTDLHGLQQVVSEEITKYDLLLMMREAYGLKIEINPDDRIFCDRSMTSSGVEKQLGFAVPSWNEQIRRMADDRTPYGDWR